MVVKLEKTSYYKGDISMDDYRNAQIHRHSVKAGRLREESYYEKICEVMSPYIKDQYSMICLGTRNNHERNCFRKTLNNDFVYSLDIAEKSGSDYICDFNFLPDDWLDKWDVVFSNSIDHGISATNIFFEWLRVVKPNGLLVLGFGLGDFEVESTDCNSFTRGSVDLFLSENIDLVEVLDVV